MAGGRIAVGVVAALVTAGAASAEDDGALTALRAQCEVDGMTAETCACLQEYVVQEFTPREIEGAARVLTDPELSADPLAAISALMGEGYTIAEILSVVDRVSELGATAEAACAAGGSGAAAEPAAER